MLRETYGRITLNSSIIKGLPIDEARPTCCATYWGKKLK
jgi:hypothetical protein